MESINLRYFAYLYFQEKEPGKYLWDNPKHRVVCRAHFANLVKHDPKAMEAALKKYVAHVKKEYDELKKG